MTKQSDLDRRAAQFFVDHMIPEDATVTLIEECATPDPRLHVGLTDDNHLILDVIQGPWRNGAKVVYSLRVDAQAMVDAIIGIEHLIPCEILPLTTAPNCDTMGVSQRCDRDGLANRRE